MTKETAEKLAPTLIPSIATQSMVCHNLALGDTGYYVLSTLNGFPAIEEMHRFECTEFSDENEALEILKF